MQQGGDGRLDGWIGRLPAGLAPVDCHADAMTQQPRALLYGRGFCFKMLLVVGRLLSRNECSSTTQSPQRQKLVWLAVKASQGTPAEQATAAEQARVVATPR